MLYLLPSLLPTKARHTVPHSKKQWKPKVLDCREGILLKAEVTKLKV